MAVASFFFYVFATITVASAFMVIAAKNPVHSVLFLILAFFNSAGLFILLGAEFIAMILVVVYVGAVAVLFLFVVMMLDIDFAELRQGFLQYLPIGGLIAAILAAEIIMVVGAWSISPQLTSTPIQPIPDVAELNNAEALGLILYTDYIFYFQTAGMILLVAMIGAIVLTLRQKAGVRRQVIADQVARTPATAIEVRQVESGKGL